MGCGDSREILEFGVKSIERKKLDYEVERKKYHDSFDIAFKLFTDDCNERFAGEISEASHSEVLRIAKNYYEDNKKTLKKDYAIDDLKELIYVCLIQVSYEYFEKNPEMAINELDLMTHATNIFKKSFFDDPKINEIKKDLINCFDNNLEEINKEITFKLKFYNLYIERENNITKYFDFIHYEHILYSEKFELEALNVYLTPSFFASGKVISYTSEIILRKPIQYLSLILNAIDTKSKEGIKKLDNLNLDPKMYGDLKELLESTSKNKTMKIFLFGIDGENKIIVPPEISLHILELVKKDQLIGLYLGRWIFSKLFFQELIESVKELKNLKVLILNTTNVDKKISENISHTLKKNTSLKIVLLSGILDLDPYIIEEFKKPMAKSNIKMLYLNSKIKNLEELHSEETDNNKKAKWLFNLNN